MLIHRSSGRPKREGLSLGHKERSAGLDDSLWTVNRYYFKRHRTCDGRFPGNALELVSTHRGFFEIPGSTKNIALENQPRVVHAIKHIIATARGCCKNKQGHE
jgi:hypothetical protein